MTRPDLTRPAMTRRDLTPPAMAHRARAGARAAGAALALVGLLAGCTAAVGQGPVATASSGHVSGSSGPASQAVGPTTGGLDGTAGSPRPSPPTSSPPARPTASSPRPSPPTSSAAQGGAASSARPTAAADPFPVPVTLGNAEQVITVKASGTWATVTAWQHSVTGWHAVLSTAAGRVGANGVVPEATRKQGTNSTPAGTFTLTQAFGIDANPGTTMPYHHVSAEDWWVEDNNSPYYNTMRQASLGGFNTTLPESDVNGSEHLIDHPGQYDYAVVINFNMDPAVPYRGAGIFLHVANSYPTAGCVSVPRPSLVAILKWLRPAAHPRIAIG